MNDVKRLSEIKIREDRKATLQFLVNKVKQRKEDFPAPPFFLLLGAGCSSDAQIPTGTGLVEYLQKRCYAENHLSITDRSLLQLGKDKIDTLFGEEAVEKKLSDFVNEKQVACRQQVDEKKNELIETIPTELVKILTANNADVDFWDVVKEEFYQASYYGFWFDVTLPDPRERQQLVEEIIDRKEPSAAYILLACVINADGIRTIFTTNFDDLVNDAILQETNKKSRIYAHNELVKFINFRSPRPNIVKLHGDYLFQDMKNTLNETATLQDDQILKLQEAAQDMGVIVTGYSGADRSIMDALYKVKDTRGPSFPLFWCGRDESNLNWRAKYLINKYPNSYYVPVDTFEQLVLKLYNDLNGKLRDVEEKKKQVEERHREALKILKRPDLRQQSPNLEKALEVDEILAQARQKKDLSERVAYLDEMITKVPPNATLYHWNGYYKDDLGRYEEAIRDYDKAIELNPADANTYSNRGLAKNNLKRYEEALVDYDKAIELDPADAAAYSDRGFVKNNLERYEEALRDFDKAIELDPSYSNAYNHKGRALRKLGKVAEAEANINRAIELDENYANAYANLAEIRAASGDAEDFYKTLETALGKGCDTEERFDDEVYTPYLSEPRFIDLLKKYNRANASK